VSIVSVSTRSCRTLPQAQTRRNKPELTIDVIVMFDDDDAWRRIRDKFAAAGLTPPMRFDAIDGRQLTPGVLQACLTPRAAYELSVSRRYPFGWVHEGVPSLGAVGCYLSHVELWKRAAERSVPTLILEQDAEPEVSFDQILKQLARVPPGVDIAFMGHLALLRPRLMERFSNKPPQGFHPVQPTSDVFCTHAYLVTPHGARKLVQRALPINAQVDAFMRFLCTPDSGVQMVYHAPSLIRQRTDVSSSVQLRGTTVDNVLQGSMMAARAVASSIWVQLCRPWYFVRRQLRFTPTRNILKEKGVSRYLIRHPGIFGLLIRSALHSYKSTAAHSSFKTIPGIPHSSSKTIWTYWDQGIDVLPTFNRLCISTWAHHNPSWSVVVLDSSNLFNYLDRTDLPPHWDRLETAQHKADLIRTALLARYGGVWMDSSILLQQSLDELVWDRIEQQALDLAGFSIRAFSRNHNDDVFENWFIACKPDSHLVTRWHQVLNELWKDRYSSNGILEEPLFKDVDLKNIDDPEYLHAAAAFQALIQKEPQCKEAFFSQSWIVPADDTAFRWQDRHGFTRASGLSLLGSEYDVEHFSTTPLLKFTGWPAGDLFARFNTQDLLDPRHTLGQLLRRNLPSEMGTSS